jgi:GNAT superfamily N-acetyltransferase
MVDNPFDTIRGASDPLTLIPAGPPTGGLPITAGLPLLGGLGVRIGRAGRSEAGEILTLQRAAYLSEALLYDDVRLPPLQQTLAELEHEFTVPSSVVMTALLGPRLVGSVRATRAVEDPTVWRIGRLIVAPDLQRRGIGSRLLAAIEGAAPTDVETFTLFTGDRSEANLGLYRRRGYVESGRETVRPGLSLVHLDKPRRSGESRRSLGVSDRETRRRVD